MDSFTSTLPNAPSVLGSDSAPADHERYPTTNGSTVMCVVA